MSAPRSRRQEKIILKAVLSACACFVMLLVFPSFFSKRFLLSQDMKKYIGSEECKGCHEELFSDMQSTPHTKLFDSALPEHVKGCEGCHGPGKDHRTLAATGQKGGMENPKNINAGQVDVLCLSCHAPSDDMPYAKSWKSVSAKYWKRSEHAKKNTSCLSCHSIHKSQTNLLTMDENALCVSCHKEKQSGKVAAHAQGKNAACVSCHDPHGSEKRHHLSKTVSINCEACHDSGKDAVLKAHGGFSLKGKECISCHGFHGKEAGLVKPVQHFPFKEKKCGSCHDEKTLALKKDANELCMGCHSGNYKSWTTNKAFVHPPVKEKFCVACHEPHASSQEKLLRDKVENVCFTCHSKIEDKSLSTYKHPPVTAGMCLACHKVKSITKGEKLIEGGIVNKCKQCHAEQMSFTHPVGENLTIPKVEKKVNVNCASCHQPHGSEYERIFKAEMTEQCRTCHTDR